MDLRTLISDDAQEAFRDGKYSMLLGAGASDGAKSKGGQSLPSGNGFAEELTKKYGLDIAPGTPLPYVWEAALAKVGSEQALRAQTTALRFVDCTPAAYHRLIPSFAWRRVFSFNVDDVVSETYRSTEDRLQTIRLVHFDDEYSESDATEDVAQLVFLHGSEAFPDKPIVFGPPAYAATVTRHHTWWHIFADSFATQPFIVLGATLREPDFETYLIQKRRPHQPLLQPSFYVSPRIDDAVRALCQRFGLQPIPLTGEQFLRELSSLVKDREKISARRARRIRSGSLLSALKDTPHLATLARQFVVVNDSPSWPLSERPPEAFYEGYDPTWDDIKASRDIQLKVETKLVQATAEHFQNGEGSRKVAIVCLEGTTGG